MTASRISPDTPTRPVPLAEVEVWHETVDVLVVGYGGAGVCAAIEAAQAGAKTLILERASGGGGTTAMAGGVIYLGGGTRVQKACGVDDSAEEMLRYLSASTPDPDPEKFRLYCEGSVAHFSTWTCPWRLATVDGASLTDRDPRGPTCVARSAAEQVRGGGRDDSELERVGSQALLQQEPLLQGFADRRRSPGRAPGTWAHVRPDPGSDGLS